MRMVHDPDNAEDVLKVDADSNGDGGDDEYDMLRYGVMAKQAKRLQLPGMSQAGAKSKWGNPQ